VGRCDVIFDSRAITLCSKKIESR